MPFISSFTIDFTIYIVSDPVHLFSCIVVTSNLLSCSCGYASTAPTWHIASSLSAAHVVWLGIPSYSYPSSFCVFLFKFSSDFLSSQRLIRANHVWFLKRQYSPNGFFVLVQFLFLFFWFGFFCFYYYRFDFGIIWIFRFIVIF